MECLLVQEGRLQKIFDRSRTEENCEKKIKLVERLWESTWNQDVSGYYYRDSVGEYWADKMKGLKILITKGRKAYKDWEKREKAIYIEPEYKSV